MNKKKIEIVFEGKQYEFSTAEEYYIFRHFFMGEEIKEIAEKVGKNYHTVYKSMTRWKKKNITKYRKLEKEKKEIERKAYLCQLAELCACFSQEDVKRILVIKGVSQEEYEEGEKLLKEIEMG